MRRQAHCASFCEDDLAICSSNGGLHLWDALTGMKKTEFVPANHQNSPFTCLSWKTQQNIAARKESGKAVKRKKKSVQTDSTEGVVALGMETGEVLLYDTRADGLLATLNGEHTDKVNCICWDRNGQRLLTCSEDQHIVHWDISSYKAICKWKGDKQGVTSIAVCPHNTLLSAGRAIKLWDMKSKVLLRKFQGHASPVLNLLIVGGPLTPMREDASLLEKVEGLYYLSAAVKDRVVNVWHVQKKHKKTAIASFSLNSEPVSMAVKLPKTKEKPVTLMVLTGTGELNIFSHVFNGPVKKPLDVRMTIKVVDLRAKKLKIISATFCKDPTSETGTLLIAYGTALKVAFEKINLDDYVMKEVALIRQDPMKVDGTASEDTSEARQPVVNYEDIANMAPPRRCTRNAEIAAETRQPKKKRKKVEGLATNASEAKAEKQIDESIGGDAEKAQSPRSDSLPVLLAQGLQSNDKEILNGVFQHSDPVVIRNTIAHLPLSFVTSLIQDLTTKLRTNPSAALKFLRWLRETLKVHSSYLMTLPDLPILSELHQTMEATSDTRKSLKKLEGKLGLIASQIEAKKTMAVVNKDPVFVYEDESSDEQEDILLDDLPDDLSDSDNASLNEWDDMEVDAKDGLVDEDETDSGVSHEMED